VEDKKTLLAFLLIGVILLVLPYYYEMVGLAPADDEEETLPVAEQSSKSPAHLAAPERALPERAIVEEKPSTSSPRERAGDRFTPREVSVQTPLLDLRFSTAGATLVSAKLPQYHTPAGQRVELMRGGGRGLALRLKDREEIIDLSSVEFAPSRETVVLDSGGVATLRMTADLGGGRSVQNTYQFEGDNYALQLDVKVVGFGNDAELFVEWEGGIAETEGKTVESSLFFAAPTVRRLMTYVNEERIDHEADEEQTTSTEDKGLVKWAAVRNQYFMVALAPAGEGPFRVGLHAAAARSADLKDDVRFEIGARVVPGDGAKSLLYLGPLSYDTLVGYEMELEAALDLGFPIIREISKVLMVIFVATHEIVPNYGVVIILLAIAIKILVYPLTHKSYESMAKMQQLQPKMAALKEKYKNDNQRLSRETMKLYKEEGVNPLGGCLPMLLQMPIFFAMYSVFNSTIELRQAPFFLWITDLSKPDVLPLGGFDLHVLPLLMAGSMFVQQKMTMKDPKQAMLVYMMPAFMIFIFWSISSGLVLYWTMFNVLSVGQQHLINRVKASQAE
jgi:YidC/Oxa1 family membrane protein insertase